ncbi:Mitochondrial inner membrane protease atp23 [Coemansia sp. RSA 1822]|nr:Mitochondrial inner membrane protease atp23 [Coemansia sp. RSA 638]KAJ2122503.1 Mitochondrial inner membrane protease atp23 [Coemansia sp. RSA 720]KAJ2477650.1 Mitochondrial inner membrane protease atp23 [Coemansia sp. RSA 2131]KAJ2539936.1 Mitochondrial inner membrane protease atp23 [Coemansia sp. RSA 1853]KAJ2565094.1 Mitochondrial inner membrane protease atp23 [Coemansia sp. RSA 1822]KAJ2664109.1 Mitochondrial inner membrane protease atp23 [Coemansia sp. RSA 1199]
MATPSDKKEAQQHEYQALDANDKGLFDNWVRAFKTNLGIGRTPAEKQQARVRKQFEQDKRDCERCEQTRDHLLKNSPMILFMTEHLKDSGYTVTKEKMPCMKCSEMRSGGYAPNGTIQLCYNQLYGKGHTETTMAHEMIHAYDQHNFNIKWLNLEHHACTEIRAASLSGDCTWFQELMRGNIGFLKHHQVCVKRRAALSLLGNPRCKSKKHAEAAVNKVFQSCFTDTRPFDEIY